LVVLAAVLLFAASSEAKQGKRVKQPNIVLVTTDDQPLSTFTREYMPQTFKRLVDKGTSFEDAVVNVPLCCPSRATLITGQYPHNHGVLANSPGYGSLVDERNVLPVWLRRAGYRTAHFGKWLHGYEDVRGTSPAPGWNRWLAQLNRRRYYDYKLSNDGRVINFGSRRRDHLTGVMTRAVSRYLVDNLGRRRPLFIQLHHYAPHVGAGPRGSATRCAGAPEPSPRDRRTAESEVAPRGPSFNEEDLSDKPYFVQPPLLGAEQLDSVDRRFRCTVESVAGVDRSLKRIFKRLRQAGEIRNTAFLFLTDNGYFLGEHRIPKGKARPWEEAIRTPLVVRPPRGFGDVGERVPEQVGSIDVVPTILALAGAEACRSGGCRSMDGRSLLPAMRGRGTRLLRNRALLIEMADDSRDSRNFACHFQALRTGSDVLIRNSEFPDPDTRKCEPGVLYEHYAIGSDPFQLRNEIGSGGLPETAEQAALAERLDRLRSCSGLEGRDPEPAGGYCE